jgi:hypothetical protein
VYVDGLGNGYSFTVPADTSTRTLEVHVGGWNSGGRLVAHLSDGSAADFVDVTPAATGQYDRNYALSYKAGSAGQTLTVRWTMDSGTGNVALNGAALASSTGGGGTAPTVTTTAATSVGTTGATLNGSANPNGAATTGWFRYSTTSPGTTCNDTFGTRLPSTGGSSLGSGTAAVAYSQAVTGLTASTTYYFCAIGSNSFGTAFGSVQSFATTPAAIGGTLSGSGTSVTTAASLTTEGTTDWIHWGETPLNRKNVTAQLTSYTAIGGGTVFSYNDDLRPLSWTDGSPTATSTNNKNGVYVDGTGNGFSFTAPADTSTRTLTVHVGGWRSGGTLLAHLSDGSAADFVDTAPAATGQYDRNYVISYKAASAAKTLTVSWIMNSGAGNVALNGAALQ